MKYLPLILLFLLSCKDSEKPSLHFLNIESSDMVQVQSTDANIHANRIRIYGRPDIKYDTCAQYIGVMGFYFKASEYETCYMRGIVSIGDTTYITPESEITVVGKNNTIIRVIKGGQPPNVK